jgi:hypothetical protein
MEALKNLSACLFPYGYIDTCILLCHLDNNSFGGLLENVIRNGSTLFVGESPTFLTSVLLCLFDIYIYIYIAQLPLGCTLYYQKMENV